MIIEATKMKLQDTDKQLIQTINEQVTILIDSAASDTTIIETLLTLIPDVQCLLNGDYDTELKMYMSEYKGFEYFVNLLNSLE